MRDAPIALLDSGVGGLTVLHEFLVSLPAENYLYLGDTGNFPYGDKPPEVLQALVRRNSQLLLERGAKLLVIACNSAEGAAGAVAREAGREAGVEVLSVIRPEAEIAAAITDNGRIGVLATPATVAGGAYRTALDGHGRELRVTEVAAPDLAPMIQAGSPFSHEVIERVRDYCGPLRAAGVDTVILGCTHYPLLAPMLQRILGRDVRLVTAGHAIAAAAQRHLEQAGIAAEGTDEGDYRFLCTGDPAEFLEVGTRFLQMPLGDVERVEVPTLSA